MDPTPAPPSRPLLVRLLTEPLSPAAIEARALRWLRPLARPLLVAAPLLLLTALAWWALDAWSRREPLLTPRHRAEALCFALAQPPRFDPPMVVEPSAAWVRGRFAAGTPAVLALRQVMRFDESMVIEEHSERVGDLDVTRLWLRLPPGETARHWLVLGWMEEGDLGVCTFRFAGTEHDLSVDERAWGDQLLARILVPGHFRAGVLPHVTLRATRDRTLPAFGPD